MNFKKIIPGVILSLILSVPCTPRAQPADTVVSDQLPVTYPDDFEL